MEGYRNTQFLTLSKYCDDKITRNGWNFFECSNVAKNILKLNNNTLENKLKYVQPEYRLINGKKCYIRQDVIIKNLQETNQLFAIPILEELNFIERKTDYNTRALGYGIPFSRIIKHNGMKSVNENGLITKGLRHELLFLDTVVYTLNHYGLNWKGNLDFQCTQVVDGFRYDLYIKCSKICIEYNEYKQHHISDIGISHDDEKKRITDGEGYLLLNFDQSKKGDDTKKNTLCFIKELIPIIRKRRHLYDLETPDNDLYLDYLEDNGVDAEIAKELQNIALYKDEFKLNVSYLMRKTYLSQENEEDVRKIYDIIKKLDTNIWKYKNDTELTNEILDNDVEKIYLNHRGFVKLSILINTDYSHKILDYYMMIDELCGKLFNEIRHEQKECFKRLEKNKDSYKYRLEAQQLQETKRIESIKQTKDIELENKDIIIKCKNKELKLIKPIVNEISKIDDIHVEKLPYALKNAIKNYKKKTTLNKNYESIKDGDKLFDELPNIVYSKYSDDCITFKEIKESWNAGILNRSKKITTYKELKEKFLQFNDYDNIKIEIEEFDTNYAHNIDNNQITNLRLISEDEDLNSDSSSDENNNDSDLEVDSDSD